MSLALASRRAAISPAWVKNPLWRTARAVPSLDQPFADTKSLTDAVTGQSLVTFTRASSGTSVGSDGLIKTATTNLLLRSEEFDNASWTLFGTATRNANVTIAPNGTQTADSIVLPVAAGIYQIVSGLLNVTYTFSIWIRADSSQPLRLVINTNLSDPTANTVNVSTVWQRFSVTKTTSVGTTSVTAQLDTGGGGTFYVWGAQLEQSSTVGEYIPTTSTINSAPRFDHNPTTGESLGLLVEEQRTNLLLRSEEFNDASWAKLNNVTVTANATTAPSGFITADKIVEPASSADKPIVQSVTLIANTTYTASVYFKAAERPTILFHVRKSDYSTRFGGFFNTSTNVFTTDTSGGGVLDSFTFTNVGGNWYRCSITGNIGANTAGIVTVYLANSSNNLTYTGDGTSGLFLWGAQLEAGAFPTSYIPTTTAAATRSADVASITGTAFSSWYRQDEGTVFAEYRLPAAGIGIVDIGDGTANNVMPVFIGAAVLQAASANAIVGGVNNGRLDSGGSFVANSLNRAAYAIKVADRALSANGATATASATPPAMPVVTQLQIQGTTNFTAGKGGTIRRLVFFPQRLPNSTLQAITQ